jgi:hypothetical protein
MEERVLQLPKCRRNLQKNEVEKGDQKTILELVL